MLGAHSFSSLTSRGRGRENISLPPQKVSFHRPWSVLGTACLELRVSFQAIQVCGLPLAVCLAPLPAQIYHTTPVYSVPGPGPAPHFPVAGSALLCGSMCPALQAGRRSRTLLQPSYVPASPIHVSSWHSFPEGSEGLREPL